MSGKTEFFLSGRLLQLQKTIVCRDSDLPDELLYGRAGYLYALLYLNTEIGPGTVCESAIKEVQRGCLSGAGARVSAIPAPLPAWSRVGGQAPLLGGSDFFRQVIKSLNSSFSSFLGIFCKNLSS